MRKRKEWKREEGEEEEEIGKLESELEEEKRKLGSKVQEKANQEEEEEKLRVRLQSGKMRLLTACFGLSACLVLAGATRASSSSVRFEPESNAYHGLTFTFDPRLDKRVEWLHFEHWLSLMQHSSSLLYEALNGRAHLAEVRVLIPHKWRHSEWPVMHKPGQPIMMNRRLRYADADVLVGFEGKFN